MELFHLIGKTKSGVSMNDVMDSYGSVVEDVQGMVQSGDIIACKNKRAKDTILYPRGDSFLTQLSGSASTAPDQDFLVTSDDLTSEIRRGDAVLVDESWCVLSAVLYCTVCAQLCYPGRHTIIFMCPLLAPPHVIM